MASWYNLYLCLAFLNKFHFFLVQKTRDFWFGRELNYWNSILGIDKIIEFHCELCFWLFSTFPASDANGQICVEEIDWDSSCLLQIFCLGIGREMDFQNSADDAHILVEEIEFLHVSYSFFGLGGNSINYWNPIWCYCQISYLKIKFSHCSRQLIASDEPDLTEEMAQSLIIQNWKEEMNLAVIWINLNLYHKKILSYGKI